MLARWIASVEATILVFDVDQDLPRVSLTSRAGKACAVPFDIKTRRLYTPWAMRLFNVRLDATDARRVDRLRREGVLLSTMVRETIRAEYDRRIAARVGRRRAAQVMAEIYVACPEPSAARPRPRPNLRARATVRDVIVERLRRARP